MLQRTAKHVVDCYERAADCTGKARTAQTQDDRDFYGEMARRWLFLARSYEFADQLDLLSHEFDGRANKRWGK